MIAQLERAAGSPTTSRPRNSWPSSSRCLARRRPNWRGPCRCSPRCWRPDRRALSALALTPQRQKQDRRCRLLVDQLEGLAAQRPCWRCEDVHWIDPSTSSCSTPWSSVPGSLPVLVVITFGRVPAAVDGPGPRHRAHAQPSGPAPGSDLVERVTGGKALPAEVIEQIVAHTDGVPLFVEELTKAVLGSGCSQTPATATSFRPAPSTRDPATLHDSLMARLDRLAPVKEVAQIGAVIGREFNQELLAAVSPLTKTRWARALVSWSGRARLRRGRRESMYIFKHAGSRRGLPGLPRLGDASSYAFGCPGA